MVVDLSLGVLLDVNGLRLVDSFMVLLHKSERDSSAVRSHREHCILKYLMFNLELIYLLGCIEVCPFNVWIEMYRDSSVYVYVGSLDCYVQDVISDFSLFNCIIYNILL